MKKLLLVNGVSRDFIRPTIASASTGIWGDLGNHPIEYLRAVVEEIWTLKQRKGWQSLWPSEPEGEYIVSLLPGDPNSIDYGLSALYETMPDRTVHGVIGTYLKAEVCGSSIVSAGGDREMTIIHDRLRDMGLKVEISSSKGSYCHRGHKVNG